MSSPARPTPVAAKPTSQRQLRVGEEIRHALASVLERGDLRDPVLTSRPITITEVRISPDLKNATAFVTPLGGGDASEVLAALRRASSFFRHELSRRLTIKFVPRISFQEDHSFDDYSHIDRLLRRADVARDLPRLAERNDDDDLEASLPDDHHDAD